MKAYLPRPWFTTAVLSGVLALGCSHSRRHCTCTYNECCSPISGRLVLLPVVPAKPKEVVAHAEPQEPPATESIAVTMAYPAPDGSPAGSVTGTIILTAAEAKAMGIRPGYTPGALYVPATSVDVALKPPPAEPAEKVAEPVEKEAEPAEKTSEPAEKTQEPAPQPEKPREPAPTFLPPEQPK
jgi:hypothetical protein